MERLVFGFFLLITSVSWSLQVSQIKVIGNTHTKTDTILKFAPELNTNNEYQEAELKKILKRVKERLDVTTWFYKADTYMVKTGNDTNKVNVIIEVEEGFLYRFGGGSIYGVYGMDNVFGGGESYMLGLGWNMQYLRIADKFLPGLFFISASGGNTPSGYYTNHSKKVYDFADTQQIGGELELGYRLLYDTRLSFINSYELVDSADYQSIGSFYKTGLRVVLDHSDSVFSSLNGFYASASHELIISQEYNVIQRTSADVRKYFLILPEQKISIASRAGAKFQSGEGAIPDYLMLSLAGIDGIRSLNIPGLIGNSSLDGHLELRWDFFQTDLFNIFNIDLETAVFGDIGTVSTAAWNVDFEKSEYAYGLAFRVFFGMPVYVPMRFEMGWDRKGAMSLFFSVSAPF